MPPQISDKGLTFIKTWEEFRAKPYRDVAGVWTIGYGTTTIAGHSVTADTPPITEPIAAHLLKDHVDFVVRDVHAAVNISRLNQNQIDALASFVYNCGFGAFMTSTIRRTLPRPADIAEFMFTAWNKIHDPVTHQLVPSAGLTRRRQAEFQLWSGK